MIHGLGILSSHQVIKNRMMLAIKRAQVASVTCRVKFKIYFRLSKHFFALNIEHFVMSTCSTAVISLQLSSAWSRLEWFWALRVCSLDRCPGVKPTFAVRLCWWGVLLLMSEGGDGVTWTDSYSCVLLVSSRGSVGLKGGLLLLCHSGSMRSRQSDEARGHHPFWWSCWCHDCVKPTYSLKKKRREQLQLSNHQEHRNTS